MKSIKLLIAIFFLFSNLQLSAQSCQMNGDNEFCGAQTVQYGEWIDAGFGCVIHAYGTDCVPGNSSCTYTYNTNYLGCDTPSFFYP